MSFSAEHLRLSQAEVDSKGVYGLPDIPGLSTSEMQRKIDGLAAFLGREKYNQLILALGAPGSGAATENEVRQMIADAMFEAGSGDMQRAVYDRHDRRTDVYAYADDLMAGIWEKIYPVGYILMTTDARNPAEYIGGEWVAWGQGRVPVGVEDAGTFAEAEATGGSATHTLTTDEMPVHTHIQNEHLHVGNQRRHSVTSFSQTTNYYRVASVTGGTNDGNSNTDTTVATNQNAGGGEAHNNLQPYITCYMWKRTGGMF